MLIVNHQQAQRVREIFKWCVKCRYLSAVVAELRQHGWCNRRWTTSKGAMPNHASPFQQTRAELLARTFHAFLENTY